MNADEIEATNRATRQAIAAARAEERPVPGDLPYYGYVDVDIFDCPPFTMFMNNDSPVVRNILMEGTFEPSSVSLWCHLCRTASGIVDIGANVGVYGLCAAKLRPDLVIHAFEPNPYAFARLRMHKAINNTLNLREHTMAVGRANELVPFTWVVKPNGNISSGASLGRRARTDVEETIVRVIKLDGTGLAGMLGPRPVIKIDVEGGEAGALTGMAEILALKPDIILETFDEKACAIINALIRSLGYATYQILEREGRLIRQDDLRPASNESGHDFNQFLTVYPLPDCTLRTS